MFIFLLLSSSCGLLATYELIEENINPIERASDGYIKGYDLYRDEISKCSKLTKDEIGSCIESALKAEGATEGIIPIIAIFGNVSVLILISWWHFRRRKKKRFSRN